jgi:hypothetical protein
MGLHVSLSSGLRFPYNGTTAEKQIPGHNKDSRQSVNADQPNQNRLINQSQFVYMKNCTLFEFVLLEEGRRRQ